PAAVIFVRQRLLPASQIDDAQPPMTECIPSTETVTAAVGSAVGHRVRHAAEQRLRASTATVEVIDANDATHAPTVAGRCRLANCHGKAPDVTSETTQPRRVESSPEVVRAVGGDCKPLRLA